MRIRGVWIAAVALLASCFGEADVDDIELLVADTGTPCPKDGREYGRCSFGVGECSFGGRHVCRAGKLVCEGDAGVPPTAAELCRTGADEDCDGEVDEAPEGQCCDDADCGDDEVCALTASTAEAGGLCKGSAQ